MQVNAPVGIIGLGLMGTALSGRLIDAKMPVIGFDIETSRCDRLKASGGMVASSVRELAAKAQTIIIAVYNGEQAAAIFGEIESGAGAARPIVACTTTCAPDEIFASPSARRDQTFSWWRRRYPEPALRCATARQRCCLQATLARSTPSTR